MDPRRKKQQRGEEKRLWGGRGLYRLHCRAAEVSLNSTERARKEENRPILRSSFVFLHVHICPKKDSAWSILERSIFTQDASYIIGVGSCNLVLAHPILNVYSSTTQHCVPQETSPSSLPFPWGASPCSGQCSNDFGTRSHGFGVCFGFCDSTGLPIHDPMFPMLSPSNRSPTTELVANKLSFKSFSVRFFGDCRPQSMLA